MPVDTWTNCPSGLQRHWRTSNKSELVASTLLWSTHRYDSLLASVSFHLQHRSDHLLESVAYVTKKKKISILPKDHKFVLVKEGAHCKADGLWADTEVSVSFIPWRRKVAQGSYFRWGAVTGENLLSIRGKSGSSYPTRWSKQKVRREADSLNLNTRTISARFPF